MEGKQLSKNTYREFKDYLKQRTDYSVSSKNKYLGIAKTFLKEISFQNNLPDLTLNTKGFNQSKKHKVEGINDEEIARLIAGIKNLPDNPQTSRLKAMVALLALQGLRQVEIIRLNVEDLDLVSHTAMVWGKGRDDKESVDLNPETVRHIQNHLRLNNVSDGPIFTSQSNNSKSQRLTTKSLREIVKETLAGLGINKTIHGFRHYFCTMMIKEYKSDLLEVMQYTRHKSVETLQVYNDSQKKKADLPRFYKTFAGISF